MQNYEQLEKWVGQLANEMHAELSAMGFGVVRSVRDELWCSMDYVCGSTLCVREVDGKIVAIFYGCDGVPDHLSFWERSIGENGSVEMFALNDGTTAHPVTSHQRMVIAIDRQRMKDEVASKAAQPVAMKDEIHQAVATARTMSLRSLALDGADVIEGLRDAEGPVFEGVLCVLEDKADAATPEEITSLTRIVSAAFMGAMDAENGPPPSETCTCWDDCDCERMDSEPIDCGSGWFDAVLDVLRSATFTPLERLETQARELDEYEAEARAWDALYREVA